MTVAGPSLTLSAPLVIPTTAQGGPADAQGRAQHPLRNIGNQLLSSPLEQTTLITDVFRIQFGLRYTFN
ncbi:MAG TPA: hypothetical protein VF970_07910 [Gemmatimonadales bacterium]